MNTKFEDRMLRALDVFAAADRYPRRTQRCYVYFVRAGGFIKIGVAVSLRIRLQSLQTACPHTLEVVGSIRLPSIEDAGEFEARLHEQFSHRRVRGEWFVDCDEIRDFIQAQPLESQ